MVVHTTLLYRSSTLYWPHVLPEQDCEFSELATMPRDLINKFIWEEDGKRLFRGHNHHFFFLSFGQQMRGG